MSEKLPRLTAADVIRVLEQAGFCFKRQTGSHKIYKNKFPQMTGQPYYVKNNTKCILPVKLEPKKEYVIWMNTVKFKNFKNKAGVSAEPYKFTFKTK